MSSTEKFGAIAKALAVWAPSTVIGNNTFRFDEEMLRHAFFTHLLPPYTSQLSGHRRADLLTMVRAVAMLQPSAITVPLNATGIRAFADARLTASGRSSSSSTTLASCRFRLWRP